MENSIANWVLSRRLFLWTTIERIMGIDDKKRRDLILYRERLSWQLTHPFEIGNFVDAPLIFSSEVGRFQPSQND